MAARVAVVTDSAACLPAALAAAWNVLVVPLHVVVGQGSQPEGTPGLDHAVVAALAQIESGADAHVSTSQPSPFECAAALERASAHVEHVVVVSLSQELSGTAQVMRQAARDARVPVTVVDSRTLGFGQGMAALSAAALSAHGASPREVIAEAERVARESFTLFTVDTLTHLSRGGRISPAVATIAGALGIKPVLGVTDGEVAVVERVRTTARARRTVVERVAVAAAVPHSVVGVMTLPDDADLDAQARQSLGEAGVNAVVSAPLSAVLAAHSGRGTLAMAAASVHPVLAESLRA